MSDIVTTPLHDGHVPDSAHPWMVTRNGQLHCAKCRQGSQWLHKSRSFEDPGRLNQYKAFAAAHQNCKPLRLTEGEPT